MGIIGTVVVVRIGSEMSFADIGVVIRGIDTNIHGILEGILLISDHGMLII